MAGRNEDYGEIGRDGDSFGDCALWFLHWRVWVASETFFPSIETLPSQWRERASVCAHCGDGLSNQLAFIFEDIGGRPREPFTHGLHPPHLRRRSTCLAWHDSHSALWIVTGFEHRMHNPWLLFLMRYRICAAFCAGVCFIGFTVDIYGEYTSMDWTFIALRGLHGETVCDLGHS